MALLAVQNLVDAGTEPTASAANLSDTAPIGSGHDTFICYKNTDTNVKTLTITSRYVLDTGDLGSNHVVSIPATTGVVKVPLRKSYDDGTGNATCVISGTGGVTGVTSYVARIS